MAILTLTLLRGVLAIGFAGSILFQVLLVTLLITDPETGGLAALRVPVVALVVLGLVAVEVTIVSGWHLLTLVQRGNLFSTAAFRYIDLIIAAVAVAGLLALAMVGGILAMRPYEDVPPGMIVLALGGAVMIFGVALVIVVLRSLVGQAIARDAEARHLEAELGGVI